MFNVKNIEQWVDKITKFIVDLVIMILFNFYMLVCTFCLHHLLIYLNVDLAHDGGTDICVIEKLTPADSTRKFSVA